MRVLVDACVSGRVRDALVAAGHDVVWVRDWWPAAPDDQVLARSVRERRILVTLDKDFGEMVVGRGLAHAGILRLVAWRAGQQVAAVLAALAAYGSELAAGAIVTVEPGRARIRHPG